MSPLKSAKYLDQGTDNPIVTKICFQFTEIFNKNILNLTQQELDNIFDYLLECMKDLLKAEEAKNNYISIEDEAIRIIQSQEGIRVQPLGISFDDPTESLKRHFEDFLTRCVCAIRRVVKIGGLVFHEETKLKGPVELKKHLSKLLEPTDPTMEMIQEDSDWMQELYNLRGASEHDKLEIGRFDVDIIDKNTLNIKTPYLLAPKGLIREYIEVTLDNCIGFCEDMIALLLNFRCPEHCQIGRMPDHLTKFFPHFKYNLNLSEKTLESLNRSIRKDQGHVQG